MEADVQFDADRAFARLVFVHQRNQCAAEAVSLLDEQLAESTNAGRLVFLRRNSRSKAATKRTL